MPQSFYHYLKKRLTQNLPGFEAQRSMMPLGSQGRNHEPTPPAGAIHCSVLAVLRDQNRLLLTLRSADLPTHKGQLSFPGGKLDRGESYEQCALREAFEEIRLENGQVTLLGNLSGIYLKHTNMYVRPVVASLDDDDFTPVLNPGEVQEAFYVSLDHLLKPEKQKLEVRTIRGNALNVPYWDVHEEVPFWGMTAMITSELLQLYREFIQQS